MTLTIDTNVLFYAVDRSDLEKYRLASAILTKARVLDCILTTQVLGEFLNAIRRKAPPAYPEARTLVEGLSRVLPIVSTAADHLLTAATLADRYKLQFWDSVILAVARSAGVDTMLTEDMQDGATVDGVMLLNPFLPANRDRIDALLSA